MPELSEIRVLVTGDDEADLAAIRGGLPGNVEVVAGLSSAVAAMRLREFGVLVADVQSVQDALVLLRAARRARPVTRGIILVPADQRAEVGSRCRDGWELVAQAAFGVVAHSVQQESLHELVSEARCDYVAERLGQRGWRRRADSAVSTAGDAEALRWASAEQRLARALRVAVAQWATRSPESVEDALRQGAAVVAEAAREANGSPEVLLAMADALGGVLGLDGVGQQRWRGAAGEAA
ncbi:MAG: hypothetical protein M0R75_05420 [Dehalococcoidia bacterium]|nr:hypothetical protein [Dehalococcoidia bacterium]